MTEGTTGSHGNVRASPSRGQRSNKRKVPGNNQRRSPTTWSRNRFRDDRDILIAATLVLAALLAVLALPDGHLLRVVLVVPILLALPGYLFLQVFFVPPETGMARNWQIMLSIGLSPVLVALLAFSTSLFPGGFRPAAIVAVVTAACLAFAVVTMYRRRRASSLAGAASESNGTTS